MATQPYAGLRHDAVLYLAQALRSIRPEQFDHDLFFAFGSQDRYSVYPLLFGHLFQLAEVWPLQPLILGLCHAAFMAGIWQLLPSQLGPRQRWLALAALALLRPLYGGMSIVGYCEPFLTARSLAEPMALWSIVSFQKNRLAIAGLLILIGASVHPLMSAPVALCLWLMLCARDRRWLVLLPLGAAAIATLAWLGRPPFDALLNQYPDDWWKLVKQANDQVLVRNWSASDWASIAIDFALVAGATRQLYRPGQRAPVLALLAGISALLALSVVGSQLYRNELITQLQPWRGLWAVRALAVALTPALLLSIARKGPAGLATACSLACVITMANLHWDATWVGMLWPALHFWIWRTNQPVRPFMLRLSTAISLAALLAIGLFDYFGLRAIPIDDATYMDFSSVGIALITLPMYVLAALAWLWRIQWRTGTERPGPGFAYGVPALAVVILMTGSLLWDRRPPMIRYLESHLQQPHPFEAFVPPGTEVYWDNNLAAAWFILKRPSYFSPPQGAGLLFNEATAHEWARRSNVVKPVIQRRLSCEMFTILLPKLPEGTPPCLSLSEDEVLGICKAAPSLQFVVSAELYERKPLAVWDVPEGREPYKTQYLYACSSFR
ncbi:hypothetical protein ACFJGW_06510 [Burkholderiaceae bacterium UC74_6]